MADLCEGPQAEQEAAAAANPDLVRKLARELLRDHELVSPTSMKYEMDRPEVGFMLDMVVNLAPTVTAVALRLNALLRARKVRAQGPCMCRLTGCSARAKCTSAKGSKCCGCAKRHQDS